MTTGLIKHVYYQFGKIGYMITIIVASDDGIEIVKKLRVLLKRLRLIKKERLKHLLWKHLTAK